MNATSDRRRENLVAVTMTRTQSERRMASHEAIVHAAMHVFREKGYARATVADIVAETDYSSGAFYHHFANKAECLWAVIDHRRSIRRNWNALTGDVDLTGRSLEDLIRAAFGRLSTSMEGIHAWTMVMVEYSRAHQDDPEETERLVALHTEWVAEVAAFVRSLQDAGLVDATLDVTDVATALIAYSEGLTTHAAIHGIDPERYDRLLIAGTLQLLVS